MQKKHKNIVIASGGTGGHLFPAQGLAAQLLEKSSDYSVLFMGKGLKTNKFFRRDLFAYKETDSFSMSLKRPFHFIFSVGRGVWQAWRFMGEFRPSIVVGFGSFHSFPVLCAALLRNIPIALFESNSIPGKVNRFFSRFAKFSAVQFVSAKKNMKGNCIEVNMPFWRSQREGLISKEEIFSYFSLKTDLFTVLVFGGSQGARSINSVFVEALKLIGDKASRLQIIHVTGKVDSVDSIAKTYLELGILACVKSFEDKMHLAWQASDVAVCRAGAATLSELVFFEVPAILIPYPHATDQHQLKNALFMSEEVGGGFCLEEDKLSQESLASLLKNLIDSKQETFIKMKNSISQFKETKEPLSLCDLVERFLLALS